MLVINDLVLSDVSGEVGGEGVSRSPLAFSVFVMSAECVMVEVKNTCS